MVHEQPPGHRLFTLASAASLLLCGAVAALRTRSYRGADCYGFPA